MSDPSSDTRDTTGTATDPALLATRLAAVERALSARECDCAHEAFEPPAPPSASRGRPTADGAPVDEDLHAAVRALCEYVLASERASSTTDERTAAIRDALDRLAPVPPGDGTDRSTATDDEPPEPTIGARAWLERVAAATFG